MQYYGTRLSENISRREPEGYLLCLNVPVARTGTQEYLPEELGLLGSGLVSVYRPEEEVFAPETLASFEGMPVTNNHPPDGVDIENIRRLQMGHAHNVRRGSGEETDLLLADLIITDPHLIDAILAGKREISCGYTYELHEENGQYIQRKIRGNHIAVVDAGRAGKRVSIKDHRCERSNSVMKKSLTRMLARMAKDGDVETVAEFIEEMLGEENPAQPTAENPDTVAIAVAVPAETEPAAPETETADAPEDGDPVIAPADAAAIIERLDRLIALLSPAPADAACAEETDPAEDGVAEEIAEVVEEVLEAAGEENAEDPGATSEELADIVEAILEPSVSTTIGEETEEEADCGGGCSPKANDKAMRAALMAVRPALQKMSPASRREAVRTMAAEMRRGGDSTGADSLYAALSAARGKAGEDPAELGKRIMASRNPNYKK